MKTKYSVFIGLRKTLERLAIFLLSFAMVYITTNLPELADKSLLDLAYEHLRPLFGGFTVSGVILFTINYLKNR